MVAFWRTSMENIIMKYVSRCALMVAFAGLLSLVSSTDIARAQEDPRPSRDPNVFKAQLREASMLAKRSIREIQSLPVDDSIPVDPQVRSNARRVYVLVRSGRWGMELAMQREETFKDPMLALAHKRVDQAWNLARTPVDNVSLPRAEYISASVRDLTRAMQLINQALVILP